MWGRNSEFRFQGLGVRGSGFGDSQHVAGEGCEAWCGKVVWGLGIGSSGLVNSVECFLLRGWGLEEGLQVWDSRVGVWVLGFGVLCLGLGV